MVESMCHPVGFRRQILSGEYCGKIGCSSAKVTVDKRSGLFGPTAFAVPQPGMPGPGKNLSPSVHSKELS